MIEKVCILVYFRSFNFPAFRPSPPEIKRPSPIGGVFLISAFDWIRNRSIVVIGCIYPTLLENINKHIWNFYGTKRV